MQAAVLMLTLTAAQLDALELNDGVTNIHAAVANGVMAAGMSARGEMTTLRWPSPGLFDQLHYVTLGTNDDGGSARSLPRRGALPDMGVFFGLAFADAPTRVVEWPRDPPWEATSGYRSDASSAVRTEYRSLRRGVSVVQEVWLHDQLPALALRIELEGDAAQLPEAIILFENLAPCDQRVAGDPSAEVALDDPASASPNDFALVYSARADALLHFRLAADDASAAQVREALAALTSSEEDHARVDALVDSLAIGEAPGTFLAIGADRPSAAHQVGRFDPLAAARPLDAYQDASDGVLRMNPGTLGSATGALHLPIAATQPEMTLYLCAGETAGDALALLEETRLLGFSQLVERVERADAVAGRAVATPDTDDREVQAVARRGVVSALAAQDVETGALVESFAAQPPLALDCPEQTAFIDAALDLAAQPGAVDRHLRFLASTTAASFGAQTDLFVTCSFTDGVLATRGPSIAATGMFVWDVYRHATQLREDNRGDQAKELLVAVRHRLQGAVEALLRCREPETDLPCQVVEGADASARLWDAAAVAAGLGAAITALDKGDAAHAQAQDRLAALRRAVAEHLTDDQGRLAGEAHARALALFPGGLLDLDPADLATERERLLQEVRDDLAVLTPGASHLGLRLWALLRSGADDAPNREALRASIEALFHEADPSTRQYGAVQVAVDQDGDGRNDTLEHRVGTPHLASGAIAYLVALDFHGRRPPAASIGPIDACFCAAPHAGSAPRPGVMLSWLALALALVLRRTLT